MRNQLTWVVMLVVVSAMTLAIPARAIVIEDVVSHHPLVAFVSSWAASDAKTSAAPPASVNEAMSPPSSAVSQVPLPDTPAVSKDNITVEIIPITLPKLPGYVVFAVYLVGAMLFYTMLVLIAQPGPAECL